MTKIDELNRVYYQKSKLFLYPLLGIPRNGEFVPVKTYLRWDGKFTTVERRLIVVFKTDDSSEFKEFDKTVLRANPRFDEFHQVSPTYGIYIFHFKDLLSFEAYGQVAKGAYSEMNAGFKQQISRFFKANKRNHLQMLSYLYPSRYYEDYAALLTVPSKRFQDRYDKEDMEDQLRRTGELCSRPDIGRETLAEDFSNLEVLKESLSLL